MSFSFAANRESPQSAPGLLASPYADWLLDLSELPVLLGTKPARSHLVHALVQLDRDHVDSGSTVRWEESYAQGLSKQFVA